MDDDALAREIRGLREQVADGELSAEDYAALRRQLVLRAAAGPAASGAAPRQGRGRGALWAVGGMLVVALVLVSLFSAVRPRGPRDYGTGNDFSAAEKQLDGGARAWKDAERAMADGRPRAAVSRYRIAVAFLPERADVRARFGFALAQADRPAESLRQLRVAVRLAPELPSARLYLGAALAGTGRRRQAERQWRRYLALAPRSPSAAVVRRELDDR